VEGKEELMLSAKRWWFSERGDIRVLRWVV